MKKKKPYKKEATVLVNSYQIDKNSDKSGTDSDADKTLTRNEPAKFDKPGKESDPDTTGIDIDADKTK